MKKCIYVLFELVYLVTCIILISMLVYLDLLPLKFFIPLVISMIILNLINGYSIIKNNKFKKLRILFIIFTVIFIIANSFGFFIMNKSLNFYKDISNSETAKEVKEKYYIMVKTDSNYKTIDDLNGILMGTFNENNNLYKMALKDINDRVQVSLKEYDTYQNCINALLNGEVFTILLSNFHYELYKEEVENIDELKILDTIEVKSTNKENENVTIPSVKGIMTIFVSGIDVYGGINYRSRSDVNMLVTVNTKNHEVLLTSIPRDYYVQLHDTTGYKDKLTHAGIYGVNCSVNTLKDLLGIDINYYLRVNFSTLIEVVDAIGGIDVYSDRTLSSGIQKGLNHMDGKTALMYARERHAYQEGDRHRIRNQQDVIKAIIDKVSKSPELMMKYTTILDKLSKYFQTNVDLNEISELIKLQIDKMPTWKFGEYCLDGTGRSDYTYSMGKQKLYVMEPDMNTVNNATKYINGMVAGKTLSELGINE